MDEKILQQILDYLNKNPNAQDDDVYKNFPSLRGDSKTLSAVYGYAHGLEQGNSPKKLKGVFPELFIAPPTEHETALSNANKTLQDAYTEHGDKAIDFLHQQKNEQEFYNSRQDQVRGQDATYNKIAPTQILKEDLEKLRTGYKEQNPTITREVAGAIGQLNPDAKPDVDAAAYLKIHEGAGDPQKQIANAKKIQSRELSYNVHNDQLIKPLGPIDSIIHGWNERHKSLAGYEFVSNASDADVIKKFNDDQANKDPDEAIPTPHNWGTLTSTIGSEGVPMAKMIVGGGVATMTGNPELAPAAAIAATSGEYYKRAYYESLQRLYYENKKHSLGDQEALTKAKDGASYNANLSVVQNAAMTAAGVKLGGIAGDTYKAFSTPGVKNVINTAIENSGKFAKTALKEGVANATISGAVKSAENVKEGKSALQDVDVASFEGGIMPIALGLMIHGSQGLVSGKGLKIIKQAFTKVPKESVNAELNNLVQDGTVSTQEAEKAKQTIDEHRQLDSKIPENVTDDEARIKIQGRIERRTELEDELKTLDKAYHPEIKEKIEKVNEQIGELTKEGKKKPEAVAEEKVPASTKPVEEVEPESTRPAHDTPILESRHANSEFDQQKKVSGHSMEGLSAEGKKDAEALGEQVADHDVSKVITSDLPRAKETAQIVADKAGVPVEERPELRSWDLGKFSGMDEAEFKPIQKYLVEHPDATEYDGKKLGESFNQYKDRVIKAREALSGEEDAMVINHSNNMNVWDAYQKNGEWNEQAAKDYLAAKSPTPATLIENNKLFVGRPDGFKDFYNKFKDEIRTIKDSKIAHRIDMPDMREHAVREQAVRNIDAGKQTKTATRFLDALQEMWDKKEIRYTTGDGNAVQKVAIPLEEWGKAEEHVADHFESDWKPHELQDLFSDEIKNYETKSAEPVHASDKQKTGNNEADATSGRTAKKESGKERVPQNDETKGDRQPVSSDRSTADETGRPGVEGKGKYGEPLPPKSTVKEIAPNKESLEKIEYARKNSYKEYKKKYPEDDVDTYNMRRARKILPKLGSGEKGELTKEEVSRYKKPTDALNKIQEAHPDNELFKRASDFLRPILEKNSNVHIDTDADFNNLSHKAEKLNPDALGYSFPDGRIAINFDKIGGDAEGLHSTILHELMHAATRSEIEKNPAFRQEIRKNLEDIRDALDTKVKGGIGDQLIPHLVSEGIIDQNKYGTTNEHELIAEVFSNQKFRDMLADLKAPESTKEAPKNMLQKIFESIVNFFNKQYGALKNVKENMSASDMADYLMQLTEKTVKTSGDAEGVHAKIDTGDEQESEKIVDEAIRMGKQTLEEAKKNPILHPQASESMLGNINKVGKRWFGDANDDVANAKSIIRMNKGVEEFELDKQFKASNKILNDWNQVPKTKQLGFILAMERPELLKSYPEATRKIAESYRERYDRSFNQIKDVLPNLNYIEDYFSHFWKKPDEVKNFFAAALSKNPLEGSKSFTKQRLFQDITVGLQKGYELTTTNPEELVRLAEMSAWKFKTAHDMFDGLKEEGLVKYSTAENLNPNWKAVKDPLFNRMGAYITKDGDAALSKGSYMMPADVAKLFNDYLSPGIGKFKNIVQAYNNIKNAFQLGFGLYHFGTTGVEASVTGITNGIQKISTLNPKNILSGIGDVIKTGTILPNIIEQVYRGSKARNDYYKGNVTTEVQSLIDANAKVGRQKMYSLDAAYNMRKAFGRIKADGDFSQLPKFAWNALLTIPEAINKPLMNWWVPSLKVGGYLKSLESEIMSRPNMSPTELQRAKERIWDSMDDRLGQVVYDNIFVNKAAKDLAFMAVRSAGWTGGTLRTGVKGVGEIPLSMQRLFKGEGLTQRTAYLIGLPLTVGLFGGMYHYAMTGERPDDWKDYFFPKDGSKNPDGTDHRTVLPSYLKDWLAYSDRPATTLLHKTSPILNDITEIYQNKDFYGEQVYNPKDPVLQKGMDVLKHELETMQPFSFRQRPGEEKSLPEQFTTTQGLEQKIGIMPAPKERERTELQNKITQAFGDQVDNGRAATHAELEQRVARRHLREYIHNGGEFDSADEELVKKANISDRYKDRFIDEAKLDPYERYFKQLKKETRIELYQKMTPEEKEKYKPYMPSDYEE